MLYGFNIICYEDNMLCRYLSLQIKLFLPANCVVLLYWKIGWSAMKEIEPASSI